jgi:hypothetical protein
MKFNTIIIITLATLLSGMVALSIYQQSVINDQQNMIKVLVLDILTNTVLPQATPTFHFPDSDKLKRT